MAKDEINPAPGQKFDPGKSFLVRGSTLNRMLDAAMPVKAGKGLKEYQTAKGKIISLEDANILTGPFMPMARLQSGAWQVAMTPGKVTERRIVGDVAIFYHTPSGLLSAGEPVWYDVTDGKCLYVKCGVGIGGGIVGTPAVAVDDEGLEGAHYRNVGFDFEGSAGEHNYTMFKFLLIGGQPRFEIFSSGSDINHSPLRPAFKNRAVEGGRKIGDVYDEETDTYWLRVIRQLSGSHVPIIKNPPAEGPADSIDFRGISDIGEYAQVKVTAAEEDGTIIVRGNSVDGSLTQITCADPPESSVILEWLDGLVITSGGVSFTAGCASSGSSGSGGME